MFVAISLRRIRTKHRYWWFALTLSKMNRKWIENVSRDCRGLQDRYAPYVIEHHNQSPKATFWADTNNLSRITSVWMPWQQRGVSRIIGDKIDVWNVNWKPFSYRRPLKVDERWPRTPMSWNEVHCSRKLRLYVRRPCWCTEDVHQHDRRRH